MAKWSSMCIRLLPFLLVVIPSFMKLETQHAMFANANAHVTMHDRGTNNEAATCLVAIFNESPKIYGNDSLALESESIFPGCWNDTFVSVSFVSGPKQRTMDDVTGPMYAMYGKQSYSFKFEIQMNLDQIRSSTELSLVDAPVQSFTRLRFCNALEYGICDISRSITRSFHDAFPSIQKPQAGQSIYNSGLAAQLSVLHEVLSSPWVSVTLQKSELNNAMFQGTLNLSVTLPSNASSGVFLIEGQTAVSLKSPNHTMVYVDMAMALPKTVAVIVESPPVIMTVSKSMVVYVYVISGVFGAFALGCFVFILHHRNHVVLTLAQGSFLAALAASCFIHMVFTFTFLPVNDIFCSIHGILEYIPMSFAGAIMVARVWRAYCTLATANAIGRRPSPGTKNEKYWSEKCIFFLGWLARLPLRCFKQYRKPAVRSTLRQTVTATETASLVIMLTLPQVILQVFGAIFYHRDLEEQWDPSLNLGRIVCEAHGAWVQELGVALAGIVYIWSVSVAWIARDLPSAFNEKSGYSTRLLSTACLLLPHCP
jgi:7 transmembrane sweet-taste receptor of 3 GCPR